MHLTGIFARLSVLNRVTLRLWSFCFLCHSAMWFFETPLPASFSDYGLAGQENTLPSHPAESIHQAVIYSTTPFLGDTILEDFRAIAILRKKFPKATIKVRTPFSHFIIESNEVGAERIGIESFFSEPFMHALFTMASDEFERSKTFQETVHSLLSDMTRGLGKNSVLYLNLHGVSRLIHERLRVQYGVETELERSVFPDVKSNIDRFTQVYFKRLMTFIRAVDAVLLAVRYEEDPVFFPFSRRTQAVRAYKVKGRGKTVHDLYQQQAQGYFGALPAEPYPRNQFVRFKPNSEFSEFQIQNGFNPDTPFIVLNMNTVGLFKLRTVASTQLKIFQDLVLAFRKMFPEVNWLISPIESPRSATGEVALQFERNRTELRRLLATEESLRGHVAMLPIDDPVLWNNAIRDAAAVVSQDSGFVHVANLIRDPEETIVYSMNDLAQIWRAPNQPYVLHLCTQDPVNELYCRFNRTGVVEILMELIKILESRKRIASNSFEPLIPVMEKLLSNGTFFERSRLFVVLASSPQLSSRMSTALEEGLKKLVLEFIQAGRTVSNEEEAFLPDGVYELLVAAKTHEIIFDHLEPFVTEISGRTNTPKAAVYFLYGGYINKKLMDILDPILKEVQEKDDSDPSKDYVNPSPMKVTQLNALYTLIHFSQFGNRALAQSYLDSIRNGTRSSRVLRYLYRLEHDLKFLNSPMASLQILQVEAQESPCEQQLR